MQSTSVVELADKKSRKRAWVAGVAAIAFLLQSLLRPILFGEIAPRSSARIDWWAFNAIIVLLVLATGGGVLIKRDIRDLMNDEISRAHLRSALAVGYWVAMVTALAIYFLPRLGELPARTGMYIVLSASGVFALLSFSYLEIRAHRDG